ncbi:MAG: glycosyltransferase [Bacteroidetes bacterium]|nr:glycosyltransferase [Bacteroidota bacterium]
MHNRPRILVVSYNIPRPDKSSGELRFVSILEMLCGFWNIDFCVAPSHAEWNNSEELIPYIQKLADLGIRVLPMTKEAFSEAISGNQYAGGYFNLYWIAEAVMPLFKAAQPGAFTIVDSVDVHFAREETQAKMGAVEMSQVLQTKKRELGVYSSADVTIAVSKDDLELLTHKEGLNNVFLIPNIVREYPRSAGKRKPVVVFIGCYAWYPNPEAVIWFADLIWPIVYASIPDAEFLVIGSDPTPEVLGLAEVPGVKVLGYVPETKPYLTMAAVSVAPLRVGGGMKGKVNEAMAHGIPVVATRIGAQGFEAVHGKEMMIADDPAEFAACVIALLKDEKKQREMGLAGQQLNSAICSHRAVKEKIRGLVARCSGLMPQNPGQPLPVPIGPGPSKLSLFIQDIGYAMQLLKREGAGSFFRRTRMYLNGQRLPADTRPQVATPTTTRFEAPAATADVPKSPEPPAGILEFPEFSETPVVSVIIPVYNQWDFTFPCLASILKNSEGISYEIILADDNSTDDTHRVNQFVKNIRVVRNEKNLGFLLNCNNAAKFARGKFIVLLNNDTLVQPEWLRWLISTMEEHADVGMVGAKFVFPTGELQEAGGIVFRDGSATNYGRYDWPGLSQYSYVKDVDYCSGACICVRTELWLKAGGFDPAFSPGYYEETDLAMQIRSMGYRTVYQPRSVIVHFEGVTHGTDLAEGIKSTQPRNQRLFFEKWKHELEANHYTRNENNFRARDRSKGRHVVLLVDHAVPTTSTQIDRQAYLQMIGDMLAKGFKIVIFPDNFYKTVPDVPDLEQKGIEVLYGGWYRENWVLWITEHAANIDSIVFIDDAIADKYSQTMKAIVPHAT